MTANDHNSRTDWPPVIVAGGFQTGVVLMRNLAHHGLRVFCIDPDRRQPAFRTVYGQAHLCPSPDQEPADWVRFMIELAKKIGGKPVIIPSSDQFVSAIGTHSAELTPHFVFCKTSAAVQALLATKQRQYEIAGTHGLAVPRTAFVTSLDEVRQFSAKALFPCILKPLHFREWKRVAPDHPMFDRKLVLAASAGELETQYKLAAEINPEVVVQEMIEGPDTAKMVYLSCYDRNSNRIGSCIVRQLRTDPIYFGSASVVEPMEDPETDALCDNFLRSLSYVGLCEIELKRDTRDGRVKMIEANPRYSVTADAALYAGVDLGWLHYLDLIGKDVQPVHPNKEPFRHIVLFRDAASYRSYLREGLLTWKDLIDSYRGPVKFFDFDPKDLNVTATHLYRIFKILVGPPIRRLLGRT
jgi:D-aspartate ligase